MHPFKKRLKVETGVASAMVIVVDVTDQVSVVGSDEVHHPRQFLPVMALLKIVHVTLRHHSVQ